MFKNFIKVAIRSILRQKAYSLINVFGLALGLASSMLIILFVVHELSYDRFHTKADQIYRLCVKGKIGEQAMDMAYTAMPTAETFTREFPEILMSCRVDRQNSVYVRKDENRFIEDQILWADSNYFRMFDFTLLKGEAEQVLAEPNSIVLSESMAGKYFGDEDPVGQSLAVFGDSSIYQVTGVVEDCPENSHFIYNFILSFHTRGDADRTMWMSHNIHTYFLMISGVDIPLLEDKIQPVMLGYVGPEVEQFLGVKPEEWEQSGNSYGMYLQSLQDIHLEPHIQQNLRQPNEPKYIYIFGLVAIFILAIAIINFMNLSTARSANRAREVGMRKVLGSGRGLLASQFLWESVFMAAGAMLAAIVLVSLVLPSFSSLIGMDLTANTLSSPVIVAVLTGMVIIVGLLAGSYPAFYLSSFRPLSVLSGKIATGMRTGWLRNILVILQFIISIGIIVCTLAVSRQINFMLSKDLGYKKEQMLVVNRIGAVGVEHIQSFKQEIGRLPGVVSSTNHTMKMGQTNNSNAYLIEGQEGESSPILATNWVDYDFAETYGLKIAEGRFFSEEMGADSVSCIINRAAVRAFNLEDPFNTRLVQPGFGWHDRVYTNIVGIVEDFHFESLHSSIDPYIFLYKPEGLDWGGYLSIRLATENIQGTIAGIEKIWKDFSNNQPFEYSFVDKDFENMYAEEVRTSKLFGIFSILAILVACLGLLGLSSYSAEQRTKEVGIRKAMGAKVPDIVRLLSRETIILVVVATIISVPLSWYFMSGWLEAYSYRVKLGAGIFIGAFAGALLIALITVSFQAVNAALKNPSDSLRYE